MHSLVLGCSCVNFAFFASRLANMALLATLTKPTAALSSFDSSLQFRLFALLLRLRENRVLAPIFLIVRSTRFLSSVLKWWLLMTRILAELYTDRFSTLRHFGFPSLQCLTYVEGANDRWQCLHRILSSSIMDCSSYMLSPRCMRWCLACGSKRSDISILVWDCWLLLMCVVWLNILWQEWIALSCRIVDTRWSGKTLLSRHQYLDLSLRYKLDIWLDMPNTRQFDTNHLEFDEIFDSLGDWKNFSGLVILSNVLPLFLSYK